MSKWEKDRYLIFDDISRSEDFQSMEENIKKKYENVLETIWDKIKEALSLKKDEYSAYIEYREKILNPKIQSKTLRDILKKFPKDTEKEFENQTEKEILDEFKKLHLIIFIPLDDESSIFLTLEGIMILFALKKAKQLPNTLYNLNGNIIENIQIELIHYYRNNTYYLIDELAKPVEIKLSRKLTIAFILFFILNGTMGEKNRLRSKKEESVNRAINYILKAFTSEKEVDESERENIKIRAFESDLSTLNKDINYAIEFNKSEYYLRTGMVKRLLSEIQNYVNDVKNKEGFLNSWNAFKLEYNKWHSLFESYNDCFYRKDRELNLERILFENSKIDIKKIIS